MKQDFFKDKIDYMKQDFFKNKNNHCILFKIYFSLLFLFISNTYLISYLHDHHGLKKFVEFDNITYFLYFLGIFGIIVFGQLFGKLIYDNFFKDTKKYDTSFLILTLGTGIFFIINVLITLISLFFSYGARTDITFESLWYTTIYLGTTFHIFSLPFCMILFSSFIFLFKKGQHHRGITIILLIFYAIIIQFLLGIPILLYGLT